MPRWAGCAALVVLAAAAGASAGCRQKAVHKRTGDAAAVEVVTTPGLPDGGTRVAVSDEVEPNDRDDAATALALGATVHGKIDPDTDVDRFRIDVTAAGALSVMVSPLDTLDAMLEIQDASGNVVARSEREDL